MKLEIISFTKAGGRVCIRLAKAFCSQGEECHGGVRPRFFPELMEEEPEPSGREIYPCELSLQEWTETHFGTADGLIYIGAVGIAVRAVAPFLKDKMTDPAVVAVDEQGTYAVSLLSGHVGGANALARRAAEILGGEPVITTASDRNGLTAVDEWAKEHSLILSDRKAAAAVAAAVVNGETVGFFLDDSRWGPVPEGYQKNRLCQFHVWVTWKQGPLPGTEQERESVTLRLIPKALTLGIGCKRGTTSKQILNAVHQVFLEYGLEPRAIRQIATIDLKKEEAGLIQAAEALDAEFLTFSSLQLQEVAGSFTASEFVKEITGIENVCERAALKGAGDKGRLLVKKQVYPGVTVAVAF